MKTFALQLALALSALGCGACLSTPTPLAPSLEGTVGVPHNGVLTSGVQLPQDGEGYVRFRKASPTYYGLPRLVDAIRRAAQEVERQYPGGAPLVVGDLSGESGGKIPRHNSHRTGRDVDLLYYLTRPDGISIENPGFIPLGADGFVQLPGEQYALLDVKRQWLLIKTLMMDPEIDIQFLFTSRELEARVMDYALSKESDLALLWHAQTVMSQPGDSLPHADHVHVRIACKPSEAVSGCAGGGPHWPWLERFPTLDVPMGDLIAEIQVSDPFELEPLETQSKEGENRLVDAQDQQQPSGG